MFQEALAARFQNFSYDYPGCYCFDFGNQMVYATPTEEFHYSAEGFDLEIQTAGKSQHVNYKCIFTGNLEVDLKNYVSAVNKALKPFNLEVE